MCRKINTAAQLTEYVIQDNVMMQAVFNIHSHVENIFREPSRDKSYIFDNSYTT